MRTCITIHASLKKIIENSNKWMSQNKVLILDQEKHFFLKNNANDELEPVPESIRLDGD